MKQIYLLILFVFALLSCSQEEIIPDRTDITGEETIHFAASLTEPIQTRAETVNLPNINITVIGPGYGSKAPNQKVVYEVINPEDPNPENEPSNLKAADAEIVMKRSAKEMYFTAWSEPEGVVIDETGVGTVDFTADLEHFIGAHYEEESPTTDLINLEFEHLVAKVTMIVYNIATDKDKPIGTTDNQKVTITFPAIKQFGAVTATLSNPPAVTAGRSGGSLVKTFGDTSAEFFLPPLSASDLLMYGSFTIKIGATTYVGTLNNLAIEQAASEIEAGQHITMIVHVNDDHTALLQAVTLAPWTEYPTNLYNRPIPGIWGMEDLELLSQLVNEGELFNWENLYQHQELKSYFFDPNAEGDVIRLYTDISLEDAKEFQPIGTDEHPFAGITFDGNGYTISGLTLENSGTHNQGLFGVVKDAKLFKVKVNSSTITGKDNVGLLAGKITGTTLIDRCSATTGTVSGANNVGGLVGYVDSEAKIYNSWTLPEIVSGANAVGGFVGRNTGKIANSYARLSRGIACSNSNAGGFVGYLNGTIENSYSKATFIQRPSNCGAWVGYHEAGSSNKGCYWNSGCIDNKYCSRVIGNNTLVKENGLEDYSALVTGRRFHDTNGHLLNDNDNNSTYLRTELNNNREKSDNKEFYQQWVVISGSSLPILSSNNFENE